MYNELKEFVEVKINSLVIEPTAASFHGLSVEESAKFTAYMEILDKIDELEKNSVQ